MGNRRLRVSVTALITAACISTFFHHNQPVCAITDTDPVARNNSVARNNNNNEDRRIGTRDDLSCRVPQVSRFSRPGIPPPRKAWDLSEYWLVGTEYLFLKQLFDNSSRQLEGLKRAFEAGARC